MNYTGQHANMVHNARIFVHSTLNLYLWLISVCDRAVNIYIMYLCSLNCAANMHLLLCPSGCGVLWFAYLSVCLCVSVCPRAYILELLHWSSQNFVCGSPVAVAWSSSSSVALRYVLLVLWMMSRLAVMGAMPTRVGTQHRRSIMCVTGVESDVYECLFILLLLELKL